MRGFSQDERSQIEADLLAVARAQFGRHGLERTRIKDITDEVGIGTSTFYQFFESKEALYLRALLEEYEELLTRIETEVEAIEDPREQFKRTLTMVFDEVESNPLISRLIVDGDLRLLESSLTEVDDGTVPDRSDFRHIPQIEDWAQDPAFRIDDPTVVSGVIHALVFSTRSKSTLEDSDAAYEDVRSVLIDIVVDGFFPSV